MRIHRRAIVAHCRSSQPNHSRNTVTKLSQRLSEIWNIDPTAMAVEFKKQPYSWGELRSTALEIDRLLNESGLGKGAAIGVILRNRPGLVATIVGTIVSERCLVCINPHYPPQTLQAEVRSLNLAAIIADADDWNVPGIVDAARSVGTMGIRLNHGAPAVELVPGLEKPSAGAHKQVPEGVALEILTSGTTGTPKRLQTKYPPLSDAILSSVRADGEDGKPQLRKGGTMLSAPLVHVSGLFSLLYPMCEGRPILLLEKFSVDEWVDTVRRHKIKFAALPPTALRMVMDANAPKEALSSLLAIRCGTAPLTPENQKRFEDTYGIPVLVQYSATEWIGGIAGWTIEEHRKYMPAKIGSIGRTHGGVKARVVDPETGKELPPGEQGILEILPSKRFGPDATWNRTTDLASIDADGFIYIAGRADDVIIRGGLKIHLPAVAETLNQHPSVKDSAVLGIPDERLGEVPVAAVELHPGKPVPSEDELRSFLRERLAPYQVPVRFKVVDALPRTVSMKVTRPAVRALFGQAS
jgi:long-chain acyl-CoA synthetase